MHYKVTTLSGNWVLFEVMKVKLLIDFQITKQPSTDTNPMVIFTNSCKGSLCSSVLVVKNDL